VEGGPSLANKTSFLLYPAPSKKQDLLGFISLLKNDGKKHKGKHLEVFWHDNLDDKLLTAISNNFWNFNSY
jgi:hypothetical protein